MKALLSALVLFVYSVPATVYLAIYLLSSIESSDNNGLGFFIIPIICMLIVCLLVFINVGCALVSAMKSKCLSFKTVMIAKLLLIPFYIVNFACWAIASMIFHIAIIAWILVPFVIAYTYLTMLGTSSYNIANLLTMRRNSSISTKQFVIHCVWQVIFIADIIDSIYLYFHYLYSNKGIQFSKK